jgi:hypothetical protein
MMPQPRAECSIDADVGVEEASRDVRVDLLAGLSGSTWRAAEVGCRPPPTTGEAIT